MQTILGIVADKLLCYCVMNGENRSDKDMKKNTKCIRFKFSSHGKRTAKWAIITKIENDIFISQHV